MKLPRKLQNLLGLVPMSDYNELAETKDRISNARHTAEEQADHNAKLCADLVEECNSQGKIIDELTDENAGLKEMVDKQAYELKRLHSEYDALAEDTLKHIRKLNRIRDVVDER